MIETSIIVKFEVDGLHYWKGATEVVSFLTNLHRHKFMIIAEKSVAHADRDIEFFNYAHSIKEHLKLTYSIDELGTFYFGGLSCEAIATELFKEFDLVSCEVWEDNECGARVVLK